MFQNLIAQDPRIYASGNNGLLNLLRASEDSCQNSPEFRWQAADVVGHAFRGFCKGAAHGYYSAITKKPYVLDKSRGYFADYAQVSRFYPDPKIVCFVRSMPDIFASLEKLYRNTPHKTSSLVNEATLQGVTTTRRAMIWDAAIEKSVTTLLENVIAGHDKKMLFIKYESFCAQPEVELQRFYNFLGLEVYQPDIYNIHQIIKEDEEAYEGGYSGLLKIRKTLAAKASDAYQILGPEVYEWIMQRYKNYNACFEYV